MYHSITIGEKNTWDDWHLIPASRPLFNPPSVKTSYLEIPGGNGVLDLTTALTGRPVYGNRSGSWTFHVENGFEDWATLYSEIMRYLHGQKFRAILEDDPAYYYEGRFSVNQWKSNANWSQIVIDYNVGPFKKEVDGTSANGTRNYRNLSISGTTNVTVTGYPTSPAPVILCSSDMSVTFGGKKYTLKKGANVLNDLALLPGENVLSFSGSGIVTIESMGGLL